MSGKGPENQHKQLIEKQAEILKAEREILKELKKQSKFMSLLMQKEQDNGKVLKELYSKNSRDTAEMLARRLDYEVATERRRNIPGQRISNPEGTSVGVQKLLGKQRAQREEEIENLRNAGIVTKRKSNKNK